MDSSVPPPSGLMLEKLPRAAQWLLLFCTSVVLAFGLDLLGMPAAFLIGPMLAGVAAGTNGFVVRVPKLPFNAAQGVVGCLVGTSITSAAAIAFLADWPIFLTFVLLTLAASGFLGWFISRLKILPGTTAVWGSAPGGSTSMVLMAEAFGADARLVAFMQYLRVILVSVTAAVVAAAFVDTSGIEHPARDWFPPIEWTAFAAGIGIVVAGCFAGLLLRLPSPFFLGSCAVGAIIHLAVGVDVQLPQWWLALSYLLIGWSVGLNFTRSILSHAARALPQIVGSTVALIAFCGALAYLLSSQFGIDPLTAYLATSPGGMDSVAIIAAATETVDLSFVMGMQAARLVLVLVLGPWLSRLLARWVSD